MTEAEDMAGNGVTVITMKKEDIVITGTADITMIGGGEDTMNNGLSIKKILETSMIETAHLLLCFRK